jgi:hypothetical protein
LHRNGFAGIHPDAAGWFSERRGALSVVLGTSQYIVRRISGVPTILAYGHLETSFIGRIHYQARADAGMRLICCVPLKLKLSICPYEYGPTMSVHGARLTSVLGLGDD